MNTLRRILRAIVAWLCSRLTPDETQTGVQYPALDIYSSPSQRERWTAQLKLESKTAVRTAYHPVGYLAGLAGQFSLASSEVEALVSWLLAHSEMLGIKQGMELKLVSEEPFYEADLTGMYGDRVKGDNPTPTQPFYEFNGEWLEQTAGTVYTLEIIHAGYPFAGMQVRGIVSAAEPILRGVYNGFVPVLKGFSEIVASPEDSAWQSAEQHVGSPLTRESSTQTWFDLSWAINRVPSTNTLHWRLVGQDNTGQIRYVFVRSSDNQVVYATPDTTYFEVRQTHQDESGNVLWDSQTLPNGCTPGMAGCSGTALAESRWSREALPKAVDLWYQLTTPGNPPFVWPFSGANRAPFDNFGRAIFVEVGLPANGIPSRTGNTYRFPTGTLSDWARTIEAFSAGIFGHEYGHTILSALKLMHVGAASGMVSPPATFTEAMSDFIGIITVDYLNDQGDGGFTFTLGRPKWSPQGGFIDYSSVDWAHRQGNLAGKGRERMGHAFYNSWKWIEGWYGNRPRSVRDANYRAWWIDIMRSFALVGDFPDNVDFYAATVSRLNTYVLIEAGVSYRLALELEALGLQNRCY